MLTVGVVVPTGCIDVTVSIVSVMGGGCPGCSRWGLRAGCLLHLVSWIGRFAGYVVAGFAVGGCRPNWLMHSIGVVCSAVVSLLLSRLLAVGDVVPTGLCIELVLWGVC